MPARELVADQFVAAGTWYFSEGRERTKRAALDFLMELPEEQFSRLMYDAEVFVVATARALVATSIPYNMALLDIPPGCARFDKRFQLVHFSPEIETYGNSELRAVVFGALTQAFAVVSGVDEGTAFHLAAEAGKAEARPAAWRKN
jgi:hypothetical protein